MLQFFNTLSGKKEEFKPLRKGEIKMYVCGPTVYDVAHLGHGRSAVAFDVIRRYFVYKGFKVKYVSNYTDIDDKMIKKAAEEGIPVDALAKKIIPEYEQDYGALGIMAPDVIPKATRHINEMVELIERLDKGGYTYVLDDGVYFDVTKFADYGKLSGQDLTALQMGARVEIKEEKRNPHDFVVWKFKKESEPFWEGPLVDGHRADGRPGWHIECSAMTWKHLGETFDIHGGGLDLTFPHHECEVAQSQAVFGHGSFARYWLHNGFIQVDNEKMSKSLGNFFTLKDIFKKYDPAVVRLMFLQTHYRNPINFSDKLLDQAKAALARLRDFVRRLKNLAAGKNGAVLDVLSFKKSFEEFMDNDFDTSGALGAVFELVKQINSDLDKKASKVNVSKILEELTEIDKVLGVIFPRETTNLSTEIKALIDEREKARKDKNFQRADEIRAELFKKGIVLEDTTKGPIWKKI